MMEEQSSAGNPIFLSLVLPVYNEEAAIERVIRDHVQALAELHEVIAGWEIVCVDDASSDGTPAVLERLSVTLTGLRVLRHQANKGIFQSFADGFAAAKGTHVYATGGDGQWPATNIERMLPPIMAGSGLVVGVRTNRRQVYSFRRRFVSFAFNLSTRLLFGVKTRDAGSIKLGVRGVFQLDLISRGPFVEAERIIKAQRCGYQVDFVPIEFQARRCGKATGANWNNVVAGVRDCVKCAAIYGLAWRRGDSVKARGSV